jgi:hypothetical protein
MEAPSAARPSARADQRRSKSFGADALVVFGEECGFTQRERPELATDGPYEMGGARHAKAVPGPPWASRMGIGQQLEAKKTKMSLLGGAPTPGSPAGETIEHASFYEPSRCREGGKCHTTGRQRVICWQSLRNSRG